MSVLAGAGSSASSVFTAMAGGTGMSAKPYRVRGRIRWGVTRLGHQRQGRGRTLGGEGVAHPLLVDDVDEDAQAQAQLLLQPAHLPLFPGHALL